jgi:hypothetical protein
LNSWITASALPPRNDDVESLLQNSKRVIARSVRSQQRGNPENEQIFVRPKQILKDEQTHNLILTNQSSPLILHDDS